MSIVVENVSKRFGAFEAVKSVNLNIKSGSLVALLSPSGSGKSTLLRLIAGLEKLDSGKIKINDQEVTKQTVQSRGIGFVFQHYALFKHMTIRQNIAFSLELRKIHKTKIHHRVEELLELVQLQGLGNRYPSQLSGGQRQRVALARTLAVEPQVLLLDEPFGALDAKVRKELRNSLRQLHEKVNVTTVFVTHDQEEAMELADQIVVFNKGEVEQVGTSEEIYNNPASPFVMSFIGPVNVLSANAEVFRHSNSDSFDSNVFLRPHDVIIHPTPEENLIPAKIKRIVYLGWEIVIELSLSDGQNVTAYMTRDRLKQLQLKSDQQVYIQPKGAKTFPGYALT